MSLFEFIVVYVLVHPVSSEFNYRFLSKLQSIMIINILSSSVEFRFTNGFEVLHFDGGISPFMDLEIMIVGCMWGLRGLLFGRVNGSLGGADFFEDVIAYEINDVDVVAAQVFGVYLRVVELKLGQLNYVCCWVV